ncbi:GNAT family N-acetyltransferase [Neobacillus ginsengisoli]|uniref:GNAT superfamily acetyltransferase n=1 Tax=Neobacillus ginsengisoli TaxID=904295 RepID=A0ABT9XVC7_9BACI|nr:GNAT family N-acetyltransferase [Neobacillus ginsengisoli]MDQ0199537.1 putative GNAT superfamily acetyltransferase [Neobacillus ginsengisoli]
MTYTKEIKIRSLLHIEELEDVRRLECKVWGENDSIPTHQTITAVKNGGLVLGAYYEGQLVGFQYSFPGFNGKSVYLCSHVLATDADFRNKGIGEKLKLAQREEALKLGYSLITWTYDPLESVNGYLNIAKLGGVSSTYIANCYGEMDDLLNSGIPTDRFLVEWHLEQEKSESKKEIEIDFAIANSLVQWDLNREGFPIPSSTLPLPNQDVKLTFVAVPKAFRAIRKTNIEAAVEWRMKTREIFIQLFQQGWEVTGFIKNTQPDSPVHFYVLTKK